MDWRFVLGAGETVNCLSTLSMCDGTLFKISYKWLQLKLILKSTHFLEQALVGTYALPPTDLPLRLK